MTIGLLPEDRRTANRKLVDLIRDSKNNSAKAHAAYLDLPVLDIVIQDGPFCSENCDICYGDFGPKKPKAPLGLYEAVARQIPDTDISQIIITDGEPFHDINRTADIARILKGIPININTSGRFARDKDNALKAFSLLKDAGFNFDRMDNRALSGMTLNSTIAFSADKFHGEGSYTSFSNAILAYLEVFTESSLKNILGEYHDTKFMLSLMSIRDQGIDPSIILKRQYDLTIEPIKDVIGRSAYEILNPQKARLISDKFEILFYTETKGYEGRAKLSMQAPASKEYTSNDLDSQEFLPTVVYLKSTGELFDCGSYKCLREGRYMGNIYDEPLNVLIKRRTKQVVHRMEREVGVQGIYHFLYNKHNLKIKASGHCDVCQQIFSNKENVDIVNKELKDDWADYEMKLRFIAENGKMPD